MVEVSDVELEDTDCYEYTVEKKRKIVRCQICHARISKKEEKRILLNEHFKEHYCHRSCYQYMRCCRCKRKLIEQYYNGKYTIETINYIQVVRGFLCFECQEYLIEIDSKQYIL